MTQTLLLKTEESIKSTQVFPQVGKSNIALYKRNNGADTAEFWIWGIDLASYPLKINGGTFTEWSAALGSNQIPISTIKVEGNELVLPSATTCYFKVKLDAGKKHCYLMFDNYLSDTSLLGGTKMKEMRADWSRRPYTINSLNDIFLNRSVNYNVENWDVSNVINFTNAFNGSLGFNQDLSSWDMSNAVYLTGMFSNSSFNRDISNWRFQSVVNLSYMFTSNSEFNQNISGWNTSTVQQFISMFHNARKFNQPLNNWDMSSAISLSNMFNSASSFNQPLNNWNILNVIDLSYIFHYAVSFNQNISSWNSTNVDSFRAAFYHAHKYNQPLNNWNTSKATDMQLMFIGAWVFNQPLNNWDVSSVLYMNNMFQEAYMFNQDISGWDVGKVTNMNQMFAYATAFDQDLSLWCAKFNTEVNLDNFMLGKTYSTNNYDKFLNALWIDVGTTRKTAWTSRVTARLLGMGTSKFSSASAAARANLISSGWTITDGGQA